MALIGYARVSTAEQDTALQTDALRKAGCERVFEDTVSGSTSERPGLSSALAFLREGDVLGVWRLDRLGRSLPHLIEVIAGLEARGVGFRSLTEAIDTTTPGGRLIFHVFGALGQFERDLIRERTKAGLSAAAARGRKGGRKPVVTDEKLQKARTLLIQGLNVREAALRLKIGKTALYAALSSTQPTLSPGVLLNLGLAGEVLVVGTDAQIDAGDFHGDGEDGDTSLGQIQKTRPRRKKPM